MVAYYRNSSKYRICVCLVGFSNDKAWDMIGEYHSKFSSLMIAHDKKLKNMVTYKDNKKSAYVTMESIKDVYTMLHMYYKLLFVLRQ